jgi:hypothetical protein
MQLLCVRMHGLEPAGQQRYSCSTCCNDSPQQHQLPQEAISSKNLPSLHSNTPLCQSPLMKVKLPGPVSCQPAASVPAGKAACAYGQQGRKGSNAAATPAAPQLNASCNQLAAVDVHCTQLAPQLAPPARLARLPWNY